MTHVPAFERYIGIDYRRQHTDIEPQGSAMLRRRPRVATQGGSAASELQKVLDPAGHCRMAVGTPPGACSHHQFRRPLFGSGLSSEGPPEATR